MPKASSDPPSEEPSAQEEPSAEEDPSEDPSEAEPAEKEPTENEPADKEPTEKPARLSGLSQKLADNPELKRYAEDAVSYHEEALSESTRTAYESGWEDFLLFCEEYDFEPLPAEAGTVALYLSFLAKKIDFQTGEVQKEGLSVPTLEQRLSAIRHYHEEQGVQSPTSSREVKKVMAGIRRNQKHRPEGAKPLMTYHVKRMMEALPKKAQIYAEKKRKRAETGNAKKC